MPRVTSACRCGLGFPWSYRHGDLLKGGDRTVFEAVAAAIETSEQADARQNTTSKYLKRTRRGLRIADRLGRCRRRNRCRSPACQRCARIFRLWIAPQAISFYQDLSEALILTLDLFEVPTSKLATVDLRLVKEALCKKMKRYEIRFCLGNLEVAYKPVRKGWCVHAHLLVFGCSEGDLKAFARTYPLPRADLVQSVKDPVEQLSYLFKFFTYYRHPSSPRPLPLPAEPLLELTDWRARHQFGDHLVLVGFRRHGTIKLPSGRGSTVNKEVETWRRRRRA